MSYPDSDSVKLCLPEAAGRLYDNGFRCGGFFFAVTLGESVPMP